jgi:autotransporter passenger strand-loop-strand repeat protein
MLISSGGVAHDTIVNSRGNIHISNGGTANNAIINQYGSMFISSGGGADYSIISGGSMVLSNGTAKNTILYKGGAIQGTGSLETIQITSNASLLVSSSNITNLLVKERGVAYLSNCTAIGIEVEKLGILQFCSGTVAANTVVHAGGHCYIGQDAIVTGNFTIENNATVIAFTGSELNFSINGITSGNEKALVNNLAAIRGNINYTITITTDQTTGVYRLADGVKNFTNQVQLECEENIWGSLDLDQDLNNGELNFDLFLEDGSLYLEISDINSNSYSLNALSLDDITNSPLNYNSMSQYESLSITTSDNLTENSTDPLKNGSLA